MSIFEYDEERELALIRKDEYNAGREDGIREKLKASYYACCRQELIHYKKSHIFQEWT